MAASCRQYRICRDEDLLLLEVLIRRYRGDVSCQYAAVSLLKYRVAR
jgi:hypothetical protein